MTIVLWDIDGTLIRSGGAGKLAMEAALRAAFGIREINDNVPYSGRTDVAIVRDLLVAHDLPTTDENQMLLREAYLHELPDCLTSAVGEILPGISQLVESFHRNENVLQGLLTGNVQRGARTKLEHFALWDFFGPGGFGDRQSDRNEVAREALQAVETHLGREANRAEIWVIGDTPHDVTCGRAIGANVLAVATGWHPIAELEACHADHVLNDLGDTDRVRTLLGIG